MNQLSEFLKNHKRTAIKVSLIFVTYSVSCVVLKYLAIDYSTIQISDFLVTFLGLFIGFAITIYTFGISIMTSISDQLHSPDNKMSDEKKNKFFKLIQSGFNELKWDIKCTSIFFVIVLFLSFVSDIKSLNHSLDILAADSVYVFSTYFSILILSVLALFDLIFAMFNISEILLFLINSKKH